MTLALPLKLSEFSLASKINLLSKVLKKVLLKLKHNLTTEQIFWPSVIASLTPEVKGFV